MALNNLQELICYKTKPNQTIVHFCLGKYASVSILFEHISFKQIVFTYQTQRVGCDPRLRFIWLLSRKKKLSRSSPFKIPLSEMFWISTIYPDQTSQILAGPKSLWTIEVFECVANICIFVTIIDFFGLNLIKQALYHEGCDNCFFGHDLGVAQCQFFSCQFELRVFVSSKPSALRRLVFSVYQLLESEERFMLFQGALDHNETQATSSRI